MKKVLITGGGGFVGFALVKRLLEMDIEPIVLGRHRYPHVAELSVQIKVGDIRDYQFVKDAANGCDHVFHVAALAGIWGKQEDYYSINYQGSKNIIQACIENQINSLVYTSTPSVVFDNNDIAGGNEKLPYASKFLCHYAASKAKAEKHILAANSDNLKTVALRPHLIWGPGDTNLIPRLINRGKRGVLKQVGDGHNLVDISYIDNVVDAHILAAQNLYNKQTAAGKAYFISQGEPVNLWGWINELFEQVGIEPVRKVVNYKKAYAAGAVFELIYKLLAISKEPLMTRFLAQQLAKSHWFSIEAAKNDFNYQPLVSNREGMERMVCWLKETESI